MEFRDNETSDGAIKRAPLPIPSTPEEVETLVKQFYGPNDPEDFARLDAALKTVQKSANAFQFADSLLDSSDTNVRFFGALTFVVKINKDWHTLNPQDAEEVLNRLLDRLASAVTAGERSLMINKLCSALVAIFRRGSERWTLCFPHVIESVAMGHRSPYPVDGATIHQQVPKLNGAQIMAIFWFATTLLEEIMKTDSNSIENNGLHAATHENIPTMLLVLDHAMIYSRFYETIDYAVAKEGTKLLQSLVQYTHSSKPSEMLIYLPRMQVLTTKVIVDLEQDQLFNTNADFIIDLLESYQSFLSASMKILLGETLAKPFFQARIQELVDGEFDEDNVAYGRFLISFAEAELKTLTENPDIDVSACVITMLTSLITCRGYAIEEDELVPQLLEFWMNYAQFVVDNQASSTTAEKTQWQPAAESKLYQVIEAFSKKTQLPPTNIFGHWDRQTQAEFNLFRRDFLELSASGYSVLGSTMLKALITAAVQLWQDKNWYELEIVLQCIRGSMEAAGDSKEAYEALAVLFNSPVIATFGDTTQEIPTVLRQAAMHIVLDCAEFFNHYPASLVPTLDFLFLCLETPSLQEGSANCIAKICGIARDHIINYHGLLAQRCIVFISAAARPTVVKKKLLAGAASVIQASWSVLYQEQERDHWLQPLNALESLLEVINQDVVRCRSDPTAVYALEEMRVSALCLLSMARAFRSPEGDLIDLADTKGQKIVPEAKILVDNIRVKITAMVSEIVHTYPSDGEIMESYCGILRAVISETMESPFKVQCLIVETLLNACISVTPRIGLLLQTVARFLRNPDPTWSSLGNEVASRCLYTALEVLDKAKGNPSDDPEIVSSIVDFAAEYVQDYPDVIFSESIQSDLVLLFNTSINCLSLKEPVPKQSGARFWVQIIDYRGTNTQINERVRMIVEEYSPALTHALICGIGGACARSEIDTLAQPIKRLIFRGGNAKTWLGRALISDSFPSQLVTQEDKQRFLQTIIGLRGKPETNAVIRQFWVKARGTFS